MQKRHCMCSPGCVAETVLESRKSSAGISMGSTSLKNTEANRKLVLILSVPFSFQASFLRTTFVKHVTLILQNSLKYVCGNWPFFFAVAVGKRISVGVFCKKNRTTCPRHRCLPWATWMSKEMKKGLACGPVCCVTAARNSSGKKAGGAGLLAFPSDSCGSVTCRVTSSSLHHVAQPVLPLIPFTFVVSVEECLGMIHRPLLGRAVICFITSPCSQRLEDNLAFFWWGVG